MDENLRAASEQGNVERLYELIRQDPDVLESINNQRFAHTPLHEAASRGHTMFMLEVMRLMPSFGTKLNPDGFSPIHLALQSPDDRTLTILQLIRANGDVIRVKGRMGMTALHWVAQSGDINLLAKFLKACPESIEDLTDKFETALHVAVKNQKVDAVKVIVGWLKYGSLYYSLDLKKNVRNFEGKTALDVLDEQQGQMDPDIAGKIRKVLRNAGVKKAGHSLAGSSRLSNRLISTIGTWRLWFYHLEIMTDDVRNALLVVAVLIATATYQVGLNPSDALLHPKNSGSSDFPLSLNHILLNLSIMIIAALLPPEPSTLRIVLALTLLYMGLSYTVSVTVIIPRLMSKIVAVICLLITSTYHIVFMIVIHVGKGLQNNSEGLVELTEN
ncbi:Ankyrin repeat [Dillenia turbinata]|uniref:Ankyrin repeat n=1 Tax=Dillenia turbinata TaxID=194707 RepID=A0AAN8V1H5_9MAGN